eukprot:746222-Amphidinium_carterae.1
MQISPTPKDREPTCGIHHTSDDCREPELFCSQPLRTSTYHASQNYHKTFHMVGAFTAVISKPASQ